MEVVISGRHMDVTPAIKEYAETKSSKLPRYYDRIQTLTITVDHRERRVFEVEMRADVAQHDPFIAKDESEDLYHAIDSVVDKMERQLTDHKEKLRNRKHMV